MKDISRSTVVLVCALLAVPAVPAERLLSGGARQAKPQECSGPGIVDTDAFEDVIVHRLGGANVVGFGLVINEGGSPVGAAAGGLARIPFVDGAKVDFTVVTDLQVASVSKTLSAIALLQLMSHHGVQPEDPIGPWLPGAWEKGHGFKGESQISFEDLMTHRTGMQQTIAGHFSDGSEFEHHDEWAGLEFLVAEGIDADVVKTACATEDEDEVWSVGAPESPEDGHFATYCYHNANYALVRVLIWNMALKSGDLPAGEFGADDPKALAENSAFGYEHYVQTNVLQPAGVSGACQADGPEPLRALMYDIDQNAPGEKITSGAPSLAGDASGVLRCGPYNWWLSALDLARVMGQLSCGDLLDPPSRDAMYAMNLGWSRNSNSASQPNRYWKEGRWTKSETAQAQITVLPDASVEVNEKAATRNRLHTCVARFPHGIDAVLILNSEIRDSALNDDGERKEDACTLLLDAFDAVT